MTTVWDDQDMGQLVDVNVGGEVDLGPLGIFLRIAAGIEKLSEQAETERRRKESLIPGDETMVGQGLFPSSGNLVLDLGSAPIGRVFQVRRIVIGGSLATNTPAGSAFAYVRGQPPSDLSTIGIVDSWPSFTTGAQGSTYGTHQLWIPPASHLFIVITGGSAGLQWVAEAQVEDFAQKSYGHVTVSE
jgi:hypothetical protein